MTRRSPRWRYPAALAAVVLVAFLAQEVLGSASRLESGTGTAHGATVLRYAVKSRFAHRSLPQVALIPPGAGNGTGRPLLVFLHGRGANGQEQNANGAFTAALEAQGTKAPDVVFPNGGDHSYWHHRKGGDWARYVLDEVIPAALRRLHADPKRVAIGGISMGGYGAYEIARLRPSAFCAVGGHSAATWLNAGSSAPGAFDDATDFARHDVVALARSRGRRPWDGAALWLDGGNSDPFHESDTVFAHALAIPLHVWPGGHDGNYWDAHYRSYLHFYANALARCH